MKLRVLFVAHLMVPSFASAEMSFPGYNSSGERPVAAPRNPPAVAPVDRPAAAAGGLWSALAVELTSAPSVIENATAAMGYARRATRAEAEREAVKQCRLASTNPSNCKVRDYFNRGCTYVSLGTTPWGQAGWGSSATPQGAYDKCASQNLNCDADIKGGCASPEDELPVDKIRTVPKIPYWGAMAVGQGQDNRSHYLSATVSEGRDKEHAKQRAIAVCNSNYPNGEVSCEAVGAFNTGCGYISRGTNEKGNGAIPWGTGPTKQVAYDKCYSIASAGDSCTTDPIGLCIQKF